MMTTFLVRLIEYHGVWTAGMKGSLLPSIPCCLMASNPFCPAKNPLELLGSLNIIIS